MNGYSSRTREIRCMDLGGEALGSYKARQGGCTHIQVGDIDSRRKVISIFHHHMSQFFNHAEYLNCTGCGMEFSKVMLRQNAYIEIK
ncbi:hypothetical protein BDR06DRAFT_939994, partial [Suillus hirtellus]